MEKITDNQKEFLLNHFFRTDDVERMFAGWRNIATKLIEDGECIVAGDGDIWVGGIGNFIKKKNPSNNAAPCTIGCTHLTFDLGVFVKSKWFQEYQKQWVECELDLLDAKRCEIDEILSL